MAVFVLIENGFLHHLKSNRGGFKLGGRNKNSTEELIASDNATAETCIKGERQGGQAAIIERELGERYEQRIQVFSP